MSAPSTTAAGHLVCRTGDLPVGARLIVDIEGVSVGVFNVHGELYAYVNSCPHRMAPVCAGGVSGTNAPSGVDEYDYTMEDRVLRCPWHGWEFDLTTGKSLFNRQRGRLGRCTVRVEGDEVLVTLPGRGSRPGVSA